MRKLAVPRTREEINERRRLRRIERADEERATRKAYYQKNKEKIKAAVNARRDPEKERAYRKANKERIKKRQRGYSIKTLYGITQDEYDKILEKQGGCAVCGRQQSEIRKLFSVDHDHVTERVRGILCHHCNLILGHAQDRRDILQSAIIYLINTKEV